MSQQQLRAEPYAGHQCRCMLTDLEDGRTDRCGDMIGNPDQPVCDGCLAKRHDRLACDWLIASLAPA